MRFSTDFDRLFGHFISRCYDNDCIDCRIFQTLLAKAEESAEQYVLEKDRDRVVEDTGVRAEGLENIWKAGQSKRIWNELYKVHCHHPFLV